MYNALIKLLVVSSCTLLPLNAASRDSINNEMLSCSAKHLDTNELVEVKSVSGIMGGKIATAQWPSGYPTIVINDSTFVKLPKNAKQFIYYHECAHLILSNKDENVADCKSINILVEKHGYSEIQVIKLIQTLTKKLGWSRRWQELLNCEGLPE